MKPRILVVEDEAGIRNLIGMVLQRAEFASVLTADAREAWHALMERLPDLVLLDWMLPGSSGVEMAKRLRKTSLTHDIPIIMLTARGEEDHRVTGLEAGADDYIVKPFKNRELIARIKAVLRRSNGYGTDSTLRFGALEVNPGQQEVKIASHCVHVGPTEFRLLCFLMKHPNQVYSRQQLLDRVWGALAEIEERTVDVHIRRLRRSLEPHQMDGCIATVRGVGYRFSPVAVAPGAA